jgi:hypothetical protein
MSFSNYFLLFALIGVIAWVKLKFFLIYANLPLFRSFELWLKFSIAKKLYDL